MKLRGITRRFSWKRRKGLRRKDSVRRGVLILALSGLSAQAEFSRLEAIGMIESGNNDSAIGGVGEISRFQIKPAIWQRYSQSRAYRNVEIASTVAERYLAWLETMFRQRTGREPSNFDRYVLWNGGPSYYAKIGFSPARVHPTIRERARRFANLCAAKRDSDKPLGSLPRAGRPPTSQPMLAVGGVKAP